jgi:hypothetical protein
MSGRPNRRIVQRDVKPENVIRVVVACRPRPGAFENLVDVLIAELDLQRRSGRV